jgi:hypothetical protein
VSDLIYERFRINHAAEGIEVIKLCSRHPRQNRPQ